MHRTVWADYDVLVKAMVAYYVTHKRMGNLTFDSSILVCRSCCRCVIFSHRLRNCETVSPTVLCKCAKIKWPRIPLPHQYTHVLSDVALHYLSEVEKKQEDRKCPSV